MDKNLLDILQIAFSSLIIPLMGMVWTTQGRLSRMEGELKSLYKVLELYINRQRND